MERRAPALTILAISVICAGLGLFDSATGVLTLTPFLLLVLPLLAGFDPAGAAVVTLAGILDRPASGTGRPAARVAVPRFVSHGRLVAATLRPRGPPVPSP